MNTKTNTRPKIKDLIKTRDKVEVPKNYKVLLLNNPITAFEAVVDVLKTVFGKQHQEASQIMYYAHMNGRALVMISTKAICEAKVEEARLYCERKRTEMMTQLNRSMFYEALEFITEEDT